MMQAPLKKQAEHLASKGRNGDTIMVHMNPAEVGIMSMRYGVKPTVNPDTGQPEMFGFLLPMLGGMAGNALLGSTLGTALATGIGAFGGSLLGGNDLKSSALSGILGGVGAGVMGGGFNIPALSPATGAPISAAPTAGFTPTAGSTAMPTPAGQIPVPYGAPVTPPAASPSFVGPDSFFYGDAQAGLGADAGMLDKVGAFAKDNPMTTLGAINALPMLIPEPEFKYTEREEREDIPENFYVPRDMTPAPSWWNPAIHGEWNYNLANQQVQGFQDGGPVSSSPLDILVQSAGGVYNPTAETVTRQTFDPTEYARLNPSVQQDMLTTQIYEDVLGRRPEAEGMEYWRDKTPEQIRTGVFGSTEFANRVANQPAAPVVDTTQFTQENFDPEAYYSTYSDVANDPYWGKDRAWEHYQQFGQGEGRTAGFGDLAIAPESTTPALPTLDTYELPEPSDSADALWQHYQTYGVPGGFELSDQSRQWGHRFPSYDRPAPVEYDFSDQLGNVEPPEPTGYSPDELEDMLDQYLEDRFGVDYFTNRNDRDRTGRTGREASTGHGGYGGERGPDSEGGRSAGGGRSYASGGPVIGFTGADPVMIPRFQEGGPVFGPGDGMSDDIPAMIDGVEPAAISTGEYVVTADDLSDLGNGDTNSGIMQLENMFKRIRKARYGADIDPEQINVEEYMPA